jgi:hypothetical protein
MWSAMKWAHHHIRRLKVARQCKPAAVNTDEAWWGGRLRGVKVRISNLVRNRTQLASFETSHHQKKPPIIAAGTVRYRHTLDRSNSLIGAKNNFAITRERFTRLVVFDVAGLCFIMQVVGLQEAIVVYRYVKAVQTHRLGCQRACMGAKPARSEFGRLERRPPHVGIAAGTRSAGGATGTGPVNISPTPPRQTGHGGQEGRAFAGSRASRPFIGRGAAPGQTRTAGRPAKSAGGRAGQPGTRRPRNWDQVTPERENIIEAFHGRSETAALLFTNVSVASNHSAVGSIPQTIPVR